MSVYVLILAGGEGSRLGRVRKADVRLGGRSLLERVTSRLRVGGGQLLVSTGPTPVNPCAFGTALPDLEVPLGGPLAGIAAAAAHLRDRAPPETMLLSVAVDTPFLPRDFSPRLLETLDRGARAAKACWHGNGYPTNAAWRLADLHNLPEQAVEGSIVQSPKALLAKLGAVAVDWDATHAEDPFASLNTLADLIDLSRRAQGSSD